MMTAPRAPEGAMPYLTEFSTGGFQIKGGISGLNGSSGAIDRNKSGVRKIAVCAVFALLLRNISLLFTARLFVQLDGFF